MKGKQNVLSEVNLMMMCYNLRRLMSIFDLNELKARLEKLVLYFFAKIWAKMRHLKQIKIAPNEKHIRILTTFNDL